MFGFLHAMGRNLADRWSPGKTMGLFTLAIGVQFIISGVSTVFRGLAG